MFGPDDQLPPWIDAIPEDAAGIVADERFGVVGDGRTDDGAALQAAIDAAAQTLAGGIVFLPAGDYRLARTIHLWRGVRLIGAGASRPRLIVREETSAFAGEERTYLLHFCQHRLDPPREANNVTFFSALIGVDVVIEPGHPELVVARYRVAQHGLLRQCDFHLGEAHAAVEEAGHMIEECRIFGGRYGVVSGRTSASWPLCVRRCWLSGQREAAIASSRAGLTVVESLLSRAPRALVPHPLWPDDLEQLYVEGCAFLEIGESVVERADAACVEQQITLRDCRVEGEPTLLRFSRSGESFEGCPGGSAVHRLQRGVVVDGEVQQEAVEPLSRLVTDLEVSPLEDAVAVPNMTPEPLPPVAQWQAVQLSGSGTPADASEPLQSAIDKGQLVYLPMGHYTLARPLQLRSETQLFGLHPGRTVLELIDATSGFPDPEHPRGMIETAQGGAGRVRGVGFKAGNNPGACGVIWRAGEGSLFEDGYYYSHFSHRDTEKERASHSIWVKDGGGGELRNLWSADVAAESGLCIEDNGPLRALMLSVEHHRDCEVLLRAACDVTFIALQTEENALSPHALAVDIDGASGLRFAQSFHYRVMSLGTAVPQAIRISQSSSLEWDNLHVFSWGSAPFLNSIYHLDRNCYVRRRELARVCL